MPRRTIASLDIHLVNLPAADAAVIEERIDPIVRRCLLEHDPHTLLYDLARCVYIAGLTDGLHLARDHGAELGAALLNRDEGASHVKEA